MLTASRARLLIRASAVFGLGLAIGISTSCDSNQNDPLVAPLADNVVKTPQSVPRQNAPYDRSAALIGKINAYRAQTFGQTSNVEHRNVPYTAALRHAAYLNSINNDQVVRTPTGMTGVQSTNLINGALLPDLRDEPTIPDVDPSKPFPALFTGPDLYSRVAAVAGSPSVLNLSPGSLVLEDYVFNGNVPLTAAGSGGVAGNSAFRGFNLDVRNAADPTRYAFDEADNLWYSIHGRILAARQSVRYMGYASVSDLSGFTPAYPLFGGRFRGVWVSIASADQVAQDGIWPNDFNTNVNPYGLDTDIQGTASYVGPPLHVTSAVAEPFLVTTTTTNPATGTPYPGIVVGFCKMKNAPDTGALQSPPPTTVGGREVKVFFNTGTGTSFFFQSAIGADSSYEFNFVSSTMQAKEGWPARDGELFIVPTFPLEPNSWYEFGALLKTASHTIEDQVNPGQMRLIRFKTNGNRAP